MAARFDTGNLGGCPKNRQRHLEREPLLATHNPGANSDTLTWDAFDRLVGMQRAGTNGFSWNAAYDGFGRRLQTRTTASGSSTTLVAQSSYDPDVLDAVVNPSAGTGTGIISDVYGHVEATVSGTSVNWNPVLCVGYGPEPGLTANPLDGSHDLSTFLAWRSKYIDPSGFYYLGNRCYDPQSGTFISADPKPSSVLP